MERDSISEVFIDTAGRLHVKPAASSFPHIWRAALEVQWDSTSNTLYAPAPRSWSYADWFGQILAAVKDEYGCTLALTKETEWPGVSQDIHTSILQAVGLEA
jgi:hypothetical protein